MEFTITKLEENTRGSGLRTENKDTALCSMQIRTSMKDTGLEDNVQGKEHTNTQMVTVTQVNGDAILKMAMECYKWRQVTGTRVTGLVEKRMEKVILIIFQVNTVLRMETFTRVTSRMETVKEKEFTPGLTIVTTRENGSMIR